MSQALPEKTAFSPYQKRVLAMLAFLQFTIVLDFMVLSPLGALLMPSLHITTKAFGWVVSMYAFSAGASGILASGYADRFDRKNMLMVFYTGFLVGTLMCGLATNYWLLMAGRIVAGLFGGVMSSIVMAITTDLFPLSSRGRVMGVIQTAFGASQIMGVPIALWLTEHFDWHAPFFMIVGVGSVAWALIIVNLQPINAHLANPRHDSPFAHLARTLSNRRYLQGFATACLMSAGGFMLMPFGSAFSVNNVGIAPHDLKKLYMATGLCALIAGPLIGRMSDSFGKYRTFVIGSSLMIVMVLYYTNMSHSTLPFLVVVSSLMFVGVQSRMISAAALMSAVPAPPDRGAFMSIQASVNQMAGGIAAAVAGMLVVLPEQGPLQHFDRVGYVVVACIIVTVVMLGTINRMVQRDPPAQPPVAPPSVVEAEA